jgi:hypothetical protein
MQLFLLLEMHSMLIHEAFLQSLFSICSHEEIDVSHPEFFSAAKVNGYVPPNKEVLAFCLEITVACFSFPVIF